MDLILKRIIVEVRYPAVFKYRDIVQDNYQQIIEFYTAYREEGQVLEMISDPDHRKIFCEMQRLGIAMENIGDVKLFFAEAERLTSLLRELKPKQVTRFGVRSLILFPVTGVSYEELINRFANNQLKRGNLVLDSKTFTDLALLIVGKDKKYRYNVNCGVVNKDEIKAQHSKFAYNKDPEVAYLNDIDVYIDNYNYEITVKRIGEMVDVAKQKAEDFYGRNKDIFKS